jgi:hypothetical protein
MANYLTVKEMHSAFCALLRGRPDIGFRMSVADRLLEQPNPFEPTAHRRPRKLIIMVGLLTILGLAAFAYFNHGV